MINGKRCAYTAIVDEGGYRLGIAVEGEAGYHQCKDGTDAGGTFKTHEAASAVADAFNKNMGLSDEEAFKIVTSTMSFGRPRKRCPISKNVYEAFVPWPTDEDKNQDMYAGVKAWCQAQVPTWIAEEKALDEERDAEKAAEAQRRLEELSAANVREAAKVQAIRLAREIMEEGDVIGVRTRNLAKAVLTAFGEAS